MQNGLIVEDHQIIALDLKYALSRKYNIIGIISSTDKLNPVNNPDVDFVVVDNDFKNSSAALEYIFKIFNCANSNIILLSSLPKNLLNTSIQYNHLINKPFEHSQIIHAIESGGYKPVNTSKTT